MALANCHGGIKRDANPNDASWDASFGVKETATGYELLSPPITAELRGTVAAGIVPSATGTITLSNGKSGSFAGYKFGRQLAGRISWSTGEDGELAISSVGISAKLPL